jgi:hypothetical protein
MGKRHFTEEEMQMVNKQTRRSSLALAIGRMQIKPKWDMAT